MEYEKLKEIVSKHLLVNHILQQILLALFQTAHDEEMISLEKNVLHNNLSVRNYYPPVYAKMNIKNVEMEE
jgi:hypothetical protein